MLPELAGTQPDFICYSQGGLLLRSALYYAKAVAGQDAESYLPLPIGKAVLISSPDGGSYIEKLGFWLGLTMEFMPLLSLKAIGFVGNQRAEAMKDMSHGIIREEDRDNSASNQVARYLQERYFGELDDIDAYQVYSLVSEKEGIEAWLGDGVVEKPSLAMLSQRVFRAKENPDSRVHVIQDCSHFQIMHTEEASRILREIYSK